MHIEWTRHLFSYWKDWFPFAADAPYHPDTNRAPRFPVREYMASLDERAIAMGVVVQPEPYGQDHRLVLYALALEQTRLRATCLFLPADREAPRKLEQLARAEPRIVAQRFHAFRGRNPYFGSWQDQAVRQLWQLAGELGLMIELHISPEQAEAAATVIEQFPDYPVVIDHLAEPGLGSEDEYAAVLTLARYPHVYMKLSALERIAQEVGTQRRQAVINQVVTAFGARRLVWGGGTLAELDDLLPGMPEAERALIRGNNLARLLRLEETDGNNT